MSSSGGRTSGTAISGADERSPLHGNPGVGWSPVTASRRMEFMVRAQPPWCAVAGTVPGCVPAVTVSSSIVLAHGFVSAGRNKAAMAAGCRCRHLTCNRLKPQTFLWHVAGPQTAPASSCTACEAPAARRLLQASRGLQRKRPCFSFGSSPARTTPLRESPWEDGSLRHCQEEAHHGAPLQACRTGLAQNRRPMTRPCTGMTGMP